MQTHSLSCEELGNRACDFVAAGSSDDEVKRKMMDHAAGAHAGAVETPAQQASLEHKIDGILARKAEEADDEYSETRGARGRYGMEEDESEGSEFLDDNQPRHAVDPGEARRNADRDAEEKRTGENLR